MISLIFLAGGTGKRLGSKTPKQYLLLAGKPLARYSFDTFLKIEAIKEIIVVCDDPYRSLFPETPFFAPSGRRRQDSVSAGLALCTQEMICIHDSARPFFPLDHFPELLRTALEMGAAAFATPALNTIKQCSSSHVVEKTLDRSTLWEMQTPQVIRKDLLLKAFQHAKKYQIEATDDLSLIEAIGHPTKIVPSSPSNIKITTPFDWTVAETFLKEFSCATK